MKIYQIHRHTGDYMDDLVGTYWLRHRAEEEVRKMEAEDEELMEQGNKCWHCPFLDCYHANLDSVMSEHGDYCDKADIFQDPVFGLDCKNYLIPPDDAIYTIDEVEVLE